MPWEARYGRRNLHSRMHEKLATSGDILFDIWMSFWICPSSNYMTELLSPKKYKYPTINIYLSSIDNGLFYPQFIIIINALLSKHREGKYNWFKETYWWDLQRQHRLNACKDTTKKKGFSSRTFGWSTELIWKQDK